jgi:lysophospholipase L1-like esterase
MKQVILAAASVMVLWATVQADGGLDWTSPPAMALRRIGDVDSQQHERGFISNLDCSLLTYRLRDSPAMQTDCFTSTAFGLVSSNTNIVIFNGSDEGQALLPNGAHQSLIPWPPTGGLISLVTDSIDGSYIGLYRNPTAQLKDEYTGFPVMLAKRLTAPPDVNIKDPDGKPLLVNASTLALSEDGSWLVVEDLFGSFVRINLESLEVLPFTRSFTESGSPGLLQSQVAVSPSGRYVAVANKEAGSLKVYDLDSCHGVITGLKPLNCSAYEYQPFISSHIPGFLTARHLRFINEDLLSFEAQDGPNTRAGVYVLAPRGSIQALTDYLGLGDSYTSGEGAFDYLAGTDTADNHCHSSVYAYPVLMNGHSVACSGAVIDDVGSLRQDYRGQVRGVATWQQLQAQSATLGAILAGFRPGYVAQVRFLQHYQPSAVTVAVGGNDIGFGDILQTCVTPHLSLRPAANSCYDSYEDRAEVTQLIDRTVPRWTALYRELQASSPGSHLYVIGYPQIITAAGSCGLNVHLDWAERQFAVELTDYLNAAIRQAAFVAGMPYIDISQALAGHRLCEASGHDIAVNGLTAGTDAGLFIKVFGKESYHPNAFGQRLIEQSVLRQLGDLTTTAADEPLPPASTPILNMPKTGRAINRVVPDDSMAPDSLVRNQTVHVQVNGLRHGLVPLSTFTVKLGSVVLGTTVADASDSLDATLTVPGVIPIGGESLQVTGRDQSGNPVIIYRPVEILDRPGEGTRLNLAAFTGPDEQDPIAQSENLQSPSQPDRQARPAFAATRPIDSVRSKPAKSAGARPLVLHWTWVLGLFIVVWIMVLMIIYGVK